MKKLGALHIGPYEVPVFWAALGDEKWGDYHLELARIRLAPGMTARRLHAVLLHEATHAIMSLMWDAGTQLNEESLANLVGNGMAQMWDDIEPIWRAYSKADR